MQTLQQRVLSLPTSIEGCRTSTHRLALGDGIGGQDRKQLAVDFGKHARRTNLSYLHHRLAPLIEMNTLERYRKGIAQEVPRWACVALRCG